MTSLPVAIPMIRVPRAHRARWATCCLLFGFAAAPHLIRTLVAAIASEPTSGAVSASLLFFAGTVAAAGMSAGHSTWGGLRLEVLWRWLAEGALFVAIAIALFVPAAVFGARTPPMTMAFALIILPSLTEELAYRGVLGASLHRLMTHVGLPAGASAALAILLGSVAFAAAHDPHPASGPWMAPVVQRLAAGVLLSILARHSRSLLAPMFAHAAFDAVVVAPWNGG